MSSRVETFFQRELSKRTFILSYALHLVVMGTALLLLYEINYHLNNILFIEGPLIILFYVLIKPTLSIFNNIFSGIFAIPKFLIFDKYNSIIVITPFLFGIIGYCLSLKKERFTIKFLLLSVALTWLISLIVSLTFYGIPWAE